MGFADSASKGAIGSTHPTTVTRGVRSSVSGMLRQRIFLEYL